MVDLFDNIILCKNCNTEMKKGLVKKNGFELRAVKCLNCRQQIIHPADINGFENYKNLKGKTYNVKLRVVGNSHAIAFQRK